MEACKKIREILEDLDIYYTEEDDEEYYVIMNIRGQFCFFINKTDSSILLSFNVKAHPIYAAILVNTLNQNGVKLNIDESFYLSNNQVLFGESAEKSAQEDDEQEVENEVKMSRILDNVDIENCHHC